jgi:hypothetical protein
MTNDYILRLIESVGAIFKKQKKESEVLSIEAMDEKDILPIILKRLTLEGKYNKAENILFEEMEKNPCEEIESIGKEFYKTLLLKSEEDFAKGNFSKDEVVQGLEDLQKLREGSIKKIP